VAAAGVGLTCGERGPSSVDVAGAVAFAVEQPVAGHRLQSCVLARQEGVNFDENAESSALVRVKGLPQWLKEPRLPAGGLPL
jgi:hypothetical protein